MLHMKNTFALLATSIFIVQVSGQTPSAVEAAEHDPINDRWLVSNGNSVLYTEDLGSSWNTLGSAAAGYGMEVIGTTLFTIHNNAIKAFDVTTGTPLGTHNPGTFPSSTAWEANPMKTEMCWWSVTFPAESFSRSTSATQPT